MLSILPFERVTREREREREPERERPFKAYPRAPVTSSSYYGPFAPPTFVGSVGIPAAHTTPHTSKRTDLPMDLRGAPSSHIMYDTHPGLMDISQPRPHLSHSHVKAESELPYPSLSPTQGYQGSSGHASMPQSASTMIPPSHPHPAGPLSTGLSPPTQQSRDHRDQNNDDGTSSSEVSPNQGKNSGIPPKKRPLSVPDDMKDGAYWEKRKKNNDSAKRSREARRMKEEQIAMRVVYLEQENLQLRTEVSLLKSEIEKLRCMLYNS